MSPMCMYSSENEDGQVTNFISFIMEQELLQFILIIVTRIDKIFRISVLLGKQKENGKM